jgi:hypothetical protein
MFLPVDLIEVDVLFVDVLELDVLGARQIFQLEAFSLSICYVFPLGVLQ